MGELSPKATITINMATHRVEQVQGGRHKDGDPNDNIEVDLENKTSTNPGTGCPAWIFIAGTRYQI